VPVTLSPATNKDPTELKKSTFANADTAVATGIISVSFYHHRVKKKTNREERQVVVHSVLADRWW
jgi:hypothetical protein